VVLVLEVISPQPAALGSAARQTFDTGGGTIGRERGNSWVLPHQKVSGRHAVITCVGGAFYIEDSSRNGTFLNSSRNRLTPGEPHPLSSGDRLLIEPYEIRVSVESDQPAARGQSPDFGSDPDPFGLLGNAIDDPFAPPQAQPMRGASFAPAQPNRPPVSESAFDAPDSVSREELDPLALLNLHDDGSAARKGPPPPNARDLEGGSLLDQHFRPPAAVPDVRPVSSTPLADPHAIPQDYDPLAPDEPVVPPPPRRQAPPPPPPPIVERSPRPPDAEAEPRPPRPRIGAKPAPPPPPRPEVPPPPPPRIEAAPPPPEPVLPPPPPPPPAPPAVSVLSPRAGAVDGTDLAAVLAGAGLNPADVTPELARAFGQIIRVVVSGVMDVLQSRREIKDEFRMRMTQFRPRENNPLKFSANVEDALHNLLVKRNAAYLGPVEAFEDAFTELRNHQVAMLAGMRVAFESMLAGFDPDRMQQDFDQRASKGLLAKLGSTNYWDLFRDKRRDMAKDPEATFRELFGEAFARAYEEQLQLLKTQGPAAARAAAKPKPPIEG
jgi:type VI secretion system FHA domain protein